MHVERLGCAAHLRREFGDSKFAGSIMDSLHESSPDAEPIGASCDEEVIDVAIRLNVCICDDLPVVFDHKRSNALNTTRPLRRIELAGCPSINLCLAVVSDRNLMDRRFEDASE